MAQRILFVIARPKAVAIHSLRQGGLLRYARNDEEKKDGSRHKAGMTAEF
jgi:hypothetical protein